ncbi:MAG: polymer-forming cytoskeletal protein [Candidatus Methylomirabilia bacterium]
MFERMNSQKRALSSSPHESEPPVLLTVVGSEAKLEGKFSISDSIQIECAVGGRLKVGKKLVIGERGSVRADVQTVDVVIHGQYEGNMVATGNVEITPTGRVLGNIKTDSLVVAKGAAFNGNVIRLKESEDEGGRRRAFAVEEMTESLPVPRVGEASPGGRQSNGGQHSGDRQGRGRQAAARRAAEQGFARDRRQSSASHESSDDNGSSGPGVTVQPADTPDNDPLGIR